MLGKIVFSFVNVVVSVDEDTTVNVGTSVETVIDGSSECVSHVGSILSSGSNCKTGPDTVRSGQGKVGVLNLVGKFADWVTQWVNGGGGGSS